MFKRLLLLFTLIPVIELVLLIQVGQYIGTGPTIGIILGTALLGAYLGKREGLTVWRSFQQKLRQGQMPGHELLDGMIVLIAGALLLTPGVLTDLAGILGLLPPSRAWLRQQVLKRLQKRMVRGGDLTGFAHYSVYTHEPAPPETTSPKPYPSEGRDGGE